MKMVIDKGAMRPILKRWIAAARSSTLDFFELKKQLTDALKRSIFDIETTCRGKLEIETHCFCGLERTLSCHVYRHCRWDRFVPKQSVFVSVLAEYHPVRFIIFFLPKK